jgi:malate dehydrogenase (oxaloacetate-decarboxylating)(NADP+)
MESGVASFHIKDWGKYNEDLLKRIGIDQKLTSRVITRAKKNPKRVVFTEANHHKILKAAQILQDEGIAQPILLGNVSEIEALIKEHKLELQECPIISPHTEKEKVALYAEELYAKRQRKGLTLKDCKKSLLDRNYFASMMVEHGDADALISGLTKDYPKTILPALQVIGTAPHVKRVAGMYIMMNKKGTFFFSDCTVNVDPTTEELVDIIGLTRMGVKFFDLIPRMAMLSYSNFGSSKGIIPDKMRDATKIATRKFPDLVIDGDIQANVALNTELQKEVYPFSRLADKGTNTLIFPNLASANIAYKLLIEMGGTEAIGPILLGMNKPVHILQLGSTIRDIVNMAAIAVVDAILREQNERV